MGSWAEVKHDSGRLYYYNKETKETTWEKPRELYTAEDELLEKSSWKKYFSKETKRYYYYNVETKKTTWNFPLADQKKEPIESKAEPESSSGSEYEQIFAIPKKEETSQEKDPKAAFMELLDKNNVDSTWSFQRVMETFIDEPAYWNISDPLQKKSYFREYLMEKSRKEMSDLKNLREKFEADFRLLIAKYLKQIHYYTRWKTFREMIREEPIYENSLLPEKEKRAIFTSHVDKLRETHENEQKKLKQQALEEFENYFNTQMKTYVSNGEGWEKVLRVFEADPRVKQNKHFESLSRLDILNVYISHFNEVVGSLKAEIKDLEKRNYREDRKARDGFRNLLNDMKQDNLFSVNSTFKEVFPYIKDDQSFLRMLGRPGSSPLELFWDIIEEQNILLRAQKDIVFNYMLEKNFKILEHPKKDFFAVLGEPQLLALINATKDNGQFLEENKEAVYELLVKQCLDDMKRQAKTVRSRFEDRKTEFRKSLEEFIMERKVTGSSPAEKSASLAKLLWSSLKIEVEKQPFFSALVKYYQTNYNLINADLEKLLDYDYFMEHASESGSQELATISQPQNQPLDEDLIKKITAQLLVLLKEEVLRARPVQPASSDAMELDY